MKLVKRFFKQNTHNLLFKGLAGVGRSFNRFYENRNHDIQSNGEGYLLKKLEQLNPKLIFDVGANVGEYAALASRHCTSAKIICFEPVSATYNVLKKNIQRVGSENINVVKKGLYKEDGTKEINIYTSNEHSSIYDIKGMDYHAQHSETIELITGDKFIEENAFDLVDLVKLDVEGAEMDALMGLEKSLISRKVRVIQFEYGYINITTKKLLLDYYEFFSRNNYILGKLYPKGVEFRNYSFKHEDFIGPNFVAIHKLDNVAKEILSLK